MCVTRTLGVENRQSVSKVCSAGLVLKSQQIAVTTHSACCADGTILGLSSALNAQRRHRETRCHSCALWEMASLDTRLHKITPWNFPMSGASYASKLWTWGVARRRALLGLPSVPILSCCDSSRSIIQDSTTLLPVNTSLLCSAFHLKVLTCSTNAGGFSQDC